MNALKTSLLALALLAAFGNAAADNKYHITVDARQLAGMGFLDLQFNPGQDGAVDANATVSAFQGLLDNSQAGEVFGNVTGSLPGTVNFNNQSGYNDLFQGVKFGGKFSFNVNFSGDYFSNPSNIGSAFALSLYAADRATVLGNGDVNSGSLVTFNLAQNGQYGAVTPYVFDSQIITITPVPEPSEWALMAGGLMALGLVARRRKQQA